MRNMFRAAIQHPAQAVPLVRAVLQVQAVLPVREAHPVQAVLPLEALPAARDQVRSAVRLPVRDLDHPCPLLPVRELRVISLHSR